MSTTATLARLQKTWINPDAISSSQRSGLVGVFIHFKDMGSIHPILTETRANLILESRDIIPTTKKRSASPEQEQERQKKKKAKKEEEEEEKKMTISEMEQHNKPYLTPAAVRPGEVQDYTNLKYYEGMPVTLHKGVWNFDSTKAFILKSIVKPNREIIITPMDNGFEQFSSSNDESWVYNAKSKYWRRKDEKRLKGRGAFNDIITFGRSVNFVADWLKEPR